MAITIDGTPEHKLYDGQVLKALGGDTYYVSVKTMERGGEWAFRIDVPDQTDMSTSNAICDAIHKYSNVDDIIYNLAATASANNTLSSNTTAYEFQGYPTANSTGSL